MSSETPSSESNETFLGTVGWVAVVAGLALVALLLLNWLGPLGGR